MSLTPGSSMDQATLAEAEELIYGKDPTISFERASQLEAIEYGTEANTADEINDQKILEMQLTVATKGWGYILEVWHKIVAQAEREMKRADISDQQTVDKKRDWLALQKAVTIAEKAASAAATTPLSTELPS